MLMFDFVVCSFIIMQIFNFTCLRLIPRLSDDSLSKIDTLAISRASINAVAHLQSVMYRTYVYGMQKALYPYANYYKDIKKVLPWI